MPLSLLVVVWLRKRQDFKWALHDWSRKDAKDTKERRSVSSTSFFHQQADVIDQVSVFIVLTARSPLTPLCSVIFSADSIVTRQTREERVVFSLSSESDMWGTEDEAVEAGVGGCVSEHKGWKVQKDKRQTEWQLETRGFVLNWTVWTESYRGATSCAGAESALVEASRPSVSVCFGLIIVYEQKKRPRVQRCLRKLLWREFEPKWFHVWRKNCFCFMFHLVEVSLVKTGWTSLSCSTHEHELCDWYKWNEFKITSRRSTLVVLSAHSAAGRSGLCSGSWRAAGLFCTEKKKHMQTRLSEGLSTLTTQYSWQVTRSGPSRVHISTQHASLIQSNLI